MLRLYKGYIIFDSYKYSAPELNEVQPLILKLLWGGENLEEDVLHRQIKLVILKISKRMF